MPRGVGGRYQRFDHHITTFFRAEDGDSMLFRNVHMFFLFPGDEHRRLNGKAHGLFFLEKYVRYVRNVYTSRSTMRYNPDVNTFIPLRTLNLKIRYFLLRATCLVCLILLDYFTVIILKCRNNFETPYYVISKRSCLNVSLSVSNAVINKFATFYLAAEVYGRTVNGKFV